MAEHFYNLSQEENAYYGGVQPQQLINMSVVNNTVLNHVSVNDFNNNNNNTRCNNAISNNARCFGAQPLGLCSTAGYHYMNKYPSTYLPGAPGNDLHTSIMPTNIIGGCQYAHLNGSTSCYNRNRYMPYNHNRACAAAAAMATTTGHQLVSQHINGTAAVTTSTAIAAYNYQQQFSSIYQQSSMSVAVPLQPTNISVSSAMVNSKSNNNNKNTTSIQAHDYTYTAGCSVALTTNSITTSSAAVTTVATNPNSLSLGSTDTTMSFIPLSTASSAGASAGTGTGVNSASVYVTDPNDAITLQITNLDYSLDESSLRNFLLNQLKPITPVVSLIFEGSSYAKVTVPDLFFAKQVVSNLHRKKIGHKRMLVSYTRDSSLTEINTLRCQVAGLLKDVPYYTLPMYKFRELFQSRFKTSISVLDLYKMQDICTISSDNNEDKFISLEPELINSLESSPLMEGLQHSVPYCTVHFKREQHKGWAEQDIEPLPNVFMTVSEIQQIVYPLLKRHTGDIPVATLVHCIEGELKMQIVANESGVNLEHLVCCVQGIQIQVNNFGIKILEMVKESANTTSNNNNNSNTGNISNASIVERNGYTKNSIADPLYQISREVIELVKTSPKSTMKFNRFIPAYHNHFGKQCRVADYGYTKLIELFEALSSVVQIMGDGENRQITLTHRTQIRRFTSDLLRVLRAHGNNSVLLSQLPSIFTQTQNRNFDVTDYGVCDIVDILDGLVNSNIVAVSTVENGKDVLISIPKRKQTNSEIEKTCIFAGEMVELFRNALQYTILFQKFVRSYHYHFAYQCRLSDYGFLKLADLMEAIHGVVEMELTNDEDKKIYLSPIVARRVFAEQCEELIRNVTGSSITCIKLEQVLKLHKKKYGYQILPQTLGVKEISEAIELLPYVELLEKENTTWIICHNDDAVFRTQCYRACKHLIKPDADLANKSKTETPSVENALTMNDFLTEYNAKNMNPLTEAGLKAMKHAIELFEKENKLCVRISSFMKFLISIVRLLEQRTNMYLHEVKCALDCNITTTFEFGYPNLYTLISAYPDIFALNVGPTQERSDVSLTANCELRQSTIITGLPAYGSLKLSYGKQKSTRSARLPLGDHNNRPIASQPPPHKMRVLSNDYVGPMPAPTTINYKTQTPLNFNNPYTSNYHTPHSQLLSHNSTKTSPPFGTYSTAPAQQKHHNSINSTASQQSSILNSSGSNLSLSSSSNKENSFNSSMQFFNSSFNSSSNSHDLNNSVGSVASMAVAPNYNAPTYAAGQSYVQGTTKLWDRRQHHYYQQQQQTQQNIFNTNLLLPQNITLQQPHAAPTNESSGLYELVNNMPMYPMFEPPKPDTPPSEHMPFWIDPIWSNNNSTSSHGNMQPKNNLLNIRLPEMKPLNVLPMLMSPYTLSKAENMKQQVFNFENHDRKIA